MSNKQELEPIAIIGSACRFPGEATSLHKLWTLISNPIDVSSTIGADRFNVDGFYHKDPSHHGTSNIRHSYLLKEDHRRFDASFFSIKPVEAEAMDPQQRLLLEVVYEALEAGGQNIHKMQGSDTAVYVGAMSADYGDIGMRDLDSIPTYFSTGSHRSILSNRISWFYDWRGPCMTIDTACSSSLVALDSAVQALRCGVSRVAVAAGSNLCLGPVTEQYVAESKLKMLSPSGRSSMWSADADGYARGEGIAAVVLKTLSSAIADGDDIECIVRATGVNQDGKTKGITVPSRVAQAALIQKTYASIGLDPNNPNQRCQYFEAHGTGTPAGDPIEAGAIAKAFFSSGGRDKNDLLYVGSIKTIIGHTEGTAGLAGVLKASLALKHKTIPPNMHFNSLSNTVKPFYKNLRIVKAAQPWPAVPTGQPRRASVNSFGFGGTNCHTILESFEQTDSSCSTVVAPFVFSAASQQSLQQQLSCFADYLDQNPQINLRDLWYTLARRTGFSSRIAFTASSTVELTTSLRRMLEEQEDFQKKIANRSSQKSAKVLGVFTGQGAQWATMGRGLIETSKLAEKRLDDLDRAISSLPVAERPSWSLRSQIFAVGSDSKVNAASVSQPLCTALQIVLVDVLASAGFKFDSVIGHSSGEIGAAYAAGLISDIDAICIAYYRGFYADLALGKDGRKGAMMALGTSFEDAQELCGLEDFDGKVTVAASNSSSSQTLSGDADAMEQVKLIFEEESKFARLLKVEVAYHSHHMLPCGDTYEKALLRRGIQSLEPSADAATWFSSVSGGEIMDSSSGGLSGRYWKDNMLNTVLFTQALNSALTQRGPFDLAIEVGPHPALQGPVSQTIQEVSGATIPYCGLLKRGKPDLESFVDALGYIWTQLSDSAVDLEQFDAIFADTEKPRIIKGLPSYAWDHERVYWHESRQSIAFRSREELPHELLGVRNNDDEEAEYKWRNYVGPKTIPWLVGHRLQGQIVFPAAGYVAMAVEAVMKILKEDDIANITITDLIIGRPLTFDDESSKAEILFSVFNLQTKSHRTTASWRCSAALKKGSSALATVATGGLQVTLGKSSHDILSEQSQVLPTMTEVDAETFYGDLSQLGYNYSGAFKGIIEPRRKLGFSVGSIVNPVDESINEERPMLIHPGLVDVGFQTIFMAHSAPKDGGLYSLHVPNLIRRISINPALCRQHSNKLFNLPFQSSAYNSSSSGIEGDVAIFPSLGQNAMIEIEGCHVVPFSVTKVSEDRLLFSQFKWGQNSPDLEAINCLDLSQGSDEDAVLLEMVKKISFLFPHLHILEIGDGSSELYRKIPTHIGAASRSYTYAMPSREILQQLETQSTDLSKKVQFKTLTLAQSLSSQGYNESFYDLVLLTRTSSFESAIEDVLGQTRALLKTGGFLLSSLNIDTHLSSQQWLDALGEAGFSNVQHASYSASRVGYSDVSLSSARASSADFDMILRPLALQEPLRDLVIVGAMTPTLQKAMTTLHTLLARYCPDIMMIRSLEDLAISTIPPMSSVIVVSDLGVPVFKDINAAKLENLKTIFDKSRNVLWVTKGSWNNDPYCNMMLGLGRTVRVEMPHLRLQFLDLEFDKPIDSQLVAETFLRLTISGLLQQDGHLENCLWYNEPELVCQSGVVNVPRVILDDEKNDRYNSRRRPITKTVDPRITSVKAVMQDKALKLSSHRCVLDASMMNINVEQSTAYAIRTSIGLGYIVYGTDAVSGKKILAISGNNSSIAAVPTGLFVAVRSRLSSRILISNTITTILVQELKHFNGRSILIYGAPTYLRAAITADPTLSPKTQFAGDVMSDSDIQVSQNSSSRSIKSKLPIADVFLDCVENEQSARIRGCMSPFCHTRTLSSFFSEESSSLNGDARDVLASATYHKATVSEHSGSIIDLDKDISNIEACYDTLLQWTPTALTVNVQPAPDIISFHSETTYLMFGLSGELGKSTALWMAERGARNFVLTSRNPASDPVWLEQMATLGCHVKVVSNDITDKQAVHSLIAEVRSTMPPIAGVVNGVMALVDGPFVNTTFEALERGMQAKVLGTITLDEIFSDDSLDFYISLCSLANAVGNSGQTVYSAANNFMAATMSQRRQKGLAGSTIDMGPLLGIGYLSRLSLDQVQEHLYKSGFMFCSERDFHDMFAEAIIASPPDSGLNHEILTGIRILSTEEPIKGPWFFDPRMQHFVHQPEGVEVSNTAGKSKQSVRAQLAKVSSTDQVVDVVQNAIIMQLESMLKLSVGGTSEQTSVLDKTADDLGIDSLVAVELRSWFLGELMVDVPVLRILGGATMRDLMLFAIESLPADLVNTQSLTTDNELPLKAIDQESKPALSNRKISTPSPVIEVSAIPNSSIRLDKEFKVHNQKRTLSDPAIEANVVPLIHHEINSIGKVSARPNPSILGFSNDSIPTLPTDGNSRRSLDTSITTTRSQETAAVPYQSRLRQYRYAQTSSATGSSTSDSDNQSVESAISFPDETPMTPPTPRFDIGPALGDFFKQVNKLPQIVVGETLTPAKASIAKAHGYISKTSANHPKVLSALVPNTHIDHFKKTMRLPMSYGQARFWFSDKFLPDKSASNVCVLYKVKGDLNTEALGEAVSTVGQRHEALRTRFLEDENYQLIQEIMPAGKLMLERYVISNENEAFDHFRQLESHNYDLDDGKTLRILLLNLSATTNFLLVGYHHIAMDGMSLQVFLADLAKSMSGVVLPEHVLQYQTFSERQRLRVENSEMHRSLSYWTQEFSELPEPLDVLPVLSATARKPLLQYAIERVHEHIDATANALVKQICKSAKVSPFHFYLAVFKTLLSALLNRDDICIGISDANRLDADSANTVGLFVNSLPIRLNSTSTTTFNQLVKNTKMKVYAAMEHSSLPFDVLLKKLPVPRSNRHAPIFQVFVDYRNETLAKQPFGNCQLEGVFGQGSKTACDIVLNIIDSPSGKVFFNFETQKSIYPPEATKAISTAYMNLIKQFMIGPFAPVSNALLQFDKGVVTGSPVTPISTHSSSQPAVSLQTLTDTIRYDTSISAVSTAQQHEFKHTQRDNSSCSTRTLAEFTSQQDLEPTSLTDTAPYICQGPIISSPWLPTIPHQVLDVASNNLDRTALEDGTGKKMTYRELIGRVNTIVDALLKLDMSIGSKIASIQHPTNDWICTLIAVLHIGAVYVALDARHPPEHLQSTVRSSEASAIVCHSETSLLAQNLGYPVLNISKLNTSRNISVQMMTATQARPDLPAIILYTSGSTGTPKGIVMNHSNWIEGLVWKSGLGPQKVLQQSALSFDMAAEQAVTALCQGGSVYVASAAQRKDPAAIARIMAEKRITFTVATPSEYRAWINYGQSHMIAAVRSWKTAISGGEVFPGALLEDLKSIGATKLNIMNGYGPSETTLGCTTYQIRLESTSMNLFPAGKVLPNYAICILDENFQPVTTGVRGEVAVSGAGVTRGYLNNATLTTDRFLANKYASREFRARGWTRMYRTGDLGYLSEDGMLHLLGRIEGDTQVKLRGMRFDVGDVETALLKVGQGAFDTVVVTPRGSPVTYIVAHVKFASCVTENSKSIRQTALQQALKQLNLPQHMIPSFIAEVQSIPLTINGKTDRKALASLPLINVQQGEDSSRMAQQAFIRPEVIRSSSIKPVSNFTPIEQELKDIWQAVIPKELTNAHNIDNNTDFFQCGGDSLLLVRVQVLIRERLNVAVPLVDMFELNTLSKLAHRIQGSSKIVGIDWEKEIAVQDELLNRDVSRLSRPVPVPMQLEAKSSKSNGWKKSLSSLSINRSQNHSPSKKEGIVVALTGATGFIGSRVLKQLHDDASVSEIHCLAVRAKEAGRPRKLALKSPRIIVHQGDLSKPRLGLSSIAATQLVACVDVIVHIGAQRSFWDNYQLLRDVNVGSTKELVKMFALQNRELPTIHYISSSEDSLLDFDKTRQTDGAEGYIASKWACEQYLKNVSEQLGMNTVVHRFGVNRVNEDEEGPEELASAAPRDFIKSMTKYTLLSRHVPVAEDWDATVRFINADELAETMISCVVLPFKFWRLQSQPAKCEIVNHVPYFTMDAQTLGEQLYGKLGWKAKALKMKEVNPMYWVGVLKHAGFAYLVSGQEIKMGQMARKVDGLAEKVLVSRR